MTTFSIGFFDSLFGRKVQIEVPGPSGENLKRTVTRKWWDRMIAEGKISRVDYLERQAAKLVSVAGINAIAIYEAVLDRVPIVPETKLNDWDFFVTVAGVFIAATRLHNMQIGEDREDHVLEIISRDLDSWNRNGTRAFEDCKSLFESEFDRLSSVGHDSNFVASDALGIWIVWNLLGRKPQTQGEVALVRAVGALVTHAFVDWWTPQHQ